MRESIAQLDRSSAGRGARAIFISCQSGYPLSRTLQSAAAEAYPSLRNANALLREQAEPEFASYIEEPDQWDLPDDTASANVGLPLFTTRLIVVGSVVGGLRQPHLRPELAWWGAPPWSVMFGYSLNPTFGGFYGQEWLYPLLYVTCPVNVLVSTFTLPNITPEDFYHIEDAEVVAEFLARNAFLYDLLVEAHGKIVEFFGEDVDAHLEVYDDPDTGGDQKLYAVIVTSLPAKDAIPLQERLDDAWWLDNLTRARGKFNIIVEYV